MTWMVQQESSQRELAERFKQLVAAAEVLKIPGAHDGLAALVARQVGFECLYLSGAAFTASQGLPDLGILTSREMAEKAREVVRACNLPLLVDIDTGYGGVLNIARTAKEMVEARVAAVQIEDQDLPKKCGHLNGKKLVLSEDMMQKIRIIKEVTPTLVVVARTDAVAVEGLNSAIERANRYVDAGADVVFPEALTSETDFRRMAENVNAPLLANMTEFGKTPYFSAAEFQRFGFSAVIYPVSSIRVAAKAYEMVFSEIMETGSQKNVLDQMQTRQELYRTIQYDAYESLDNSIAKMVLPIIGKENG